MGMRGHGRALWSLDFSRAVSNFAVSGQIKLQVMGTPLASFIKTLMFLECPFGKANPLFFVRSGKGLFFVPSPTNRSAAARSGGQKPRLRGDWSHAEP